MFVQLLLLLVISCNLITNIDSKSKLISCYECDKCPAGSRTTEPICKSCSTKYYKGILSKQCLKRNTGFITEGEWTEKDYYFSCTKNLCNSEGETPVPSQSTMISCYECDNCPDGSRMTEPICKKCGIKYYQGIISKKCFKSDSSIDKNDTYNICNQNLCNSGGETSVPSQSTMISCYECDNCPDGSRTTEPICKKCGTKYYKGIVSKKCFKGDTLINKEDNYNICNQNLCNSGGETSVPSQSTMISCYECDNCPNNIKKSEPKCKSCSTKTGTNGKSSTIKKKCHEDYKTNDPNGKESIRYCYKDFCNSATKIPILKSGLVGIVAIAIATIL